MSPARRSLALAMVLAATASDALWAQAGGSAEPPRVLTRFSAPHQPLILSRTLRRMMPDGQVFAVTRRYRVHFSQDGAGFRVDGELIAVDVDAPPRLATFADLERARPDTGMFPLHLDAAGMLLPRLPIASGDEVRQAIALAVDRMGQGQMPAIDLLEAQAFIERFRKRPPSSQWPADIFRPLAETSRRDTQVPLPGGAQGHITIDIAARSAEAGGLMREMSRTITTDLGGDLRQSHESWTLEPAGA